MDVRPDEQCAECGTYFNADDLGRRTRGGTMCWRCRQSREPQPQTKVHLTWVRYLTRAMIKERLCTAVVLRRTAAEAPKPGHLLEIGCVTATREDPRPLVVIRFVEEESAGVYVCSFELVR